MFFGKKSSFFTQNFRNFTENVISDVTKSPLFFVCKFHHRLTESSISAMKFRLDVTNYNSKHIFYIGEDTYKLYSLFSNPYTSYNMLCDMYVTKFEINIV